MKSLALLLVLAIGVSLAVLVTPSAFADTPDKPLDLTLEPRFFSINVSWEAPVDNGTPITGYVVKVHDGTSWESDTQHLPSNTNSYLYTNLLEDHLYKFQVLAKGEDGSGPSSGVKSAKTFKWDFYDDPIQPNAIGSYDSGLNQISISWNFTATNSAGDGAPTKCLLKGDFNFNDNVNYDPLDSSYFNSFTPTYYSVSSNPVTFEAHNHIGNFAEEVSCTGNLLIDVDSILNHETNVLNLSGF